MMKCLPLDPHTDLCVIVTVKLIHRGPEPERLAEAMAQNDRKMRAGSLGSQYEEAIAGQLKAKLLEEQ